MAPANLSSDDDVYVKSPLIDPHDKFSPQSLSVSQESIVTVHSVFGFEIQS